ncbi:CoA-transferase [Microbacterium mangrovi]|uniref:CoA-transferase n=1 Tax=Microbacterium mangrovi TaxID=1348253 RepID=A0A0B2A6Q2_9MICO|nr:CoA-transferase [Microbacterium mangrovi]
MSGITVLDLGRALAGPFCTALLADLGATIIKVEGLGGDTARTWPPFEDAHSLYFDSVNRGKRSVCVDFYSTEGRDILHRLVAGSDVLIENFRAGTLAKMGLDTDTLHRLNPDLVVASVTAFGDRGPLRDAPGLDQVVQGMSGLTSVTGPDAQHTYRFGVSIVDITSGLTCAIGVLAGLLGRSRGVDVRHVSTSLLETAMALGTFQGQQALSLGIEPVPQGNAHPSIAPCGVFRTGSSDLTIAVASDRHWRAFCRIIDAEHLLADERFLDEPARLANRRELTEQIESRLASAGAEHWVELFHGAGIPCGPINGYLAAFDSEQVRALELVQSVRRNDDTLLRLVRGPISVNEQPPRVGSAPPQLGEHTHEVLRELGYDDGEIGDLTVRGIVRAGVSDD